MAGSFIRRATKTVILFINLFVAVIFLLASLTPFVPTATWWILGFTGLAVPYAIVILFFFAIFWLIVKPKLSLISIIVLCIGWQQIGVIAAVKPGPMLSDRKRENHLRIIDWNIQSFNGLSKKPLVKQQIRKDIAASILLLEPDVICLRSGIDEINHTLASEIAERLLLVGIEVVEARISNLSYAPEIASAMLRRQQATAVIAARQKIVEGAVGMVKLALESLKEKDIIELDDDKKASMVSNLLVVLCADDSVKPVINTGTLH